MLFNSTKEFKQVIHSVCLYFPKDARYVLRENWDNLYFVTWSGFGFGSRSMMVNDNHIYKCRTIFVLFIYMYLHRDACTLSTILTNLHFSPLLFFLQEHLVEHIFTTKVFFDNIEVTFLMWRMEKILYDFPKSQKAKIQRQVQTVFKFVFCTSGSMDQTMWLGNINTG